MSLSGYKQFIEPNDTVILYLCNNLHAVLVQEKIRNKNGLLVENVYQTPFGALKVKDLIGVQYGSKVSQNFILVFSLNIYLCIMVPS